MLVATEFFTWAKPLLGLDRSNDKHRQFYGQLMLLHCLRVINYYILFFKSRFISLFHREYKWFNIDSNSTESQFNNVCGYKFLFESSWEWFARVGWFDFALAETFFLWSWMASTQVVVSFREVIPLLPFDFWLLIGWK